MELNIEHTNVFTRNYEALNDDSIRFVINQGSSRSSKSFSLSQLVIIYCLQNPGKSVSVVRKTLPSLRETAMKDIFELLNKYKLYSEKQHNKTRNIYTFSNGSYLEFFSLDDSQKVRGRKRDILWCEEANEVDRETFVQLNIRTTTKVFASFNPSDSEHWLYDIIEKPDSILIHSTYKDNTFLPKEQVKEIEDLINIDQDYYNIYALGLPSRSNHVIYSHQQSFDILPDNIIETIYGLDFGFVHPTALIKCDFTDNEVYLTEILYESYLTTDELIDRMNTLEIPKNIKIVGDYARPEIIEQIRREGYDIHNAIKNVKEGIDAVKSIRLNYHIDSTNVAREFRNYKWKMINDKLQDEPVKLHDDAMDAIRYAVLYKRKMGGKATDIYDFGFL
jgi:phage terminase large subunit